MQSTTAGRRIDRIEEDEIEAAVARLDALATLMDSAVQIPGTSIRMGLDALVGLVPVVGDLVGQAVAGYIIWEARRLGVSRWVVARMAANSLIDTAIGAIPIAGDVFDVAFKANRKNVALLRRHIERTGRLRGRVIEGEYRRLP
jgi:hypothetical protein